MEVAGGTVLVLAERAAGVVAHLADMVHRSPWCVFEGASVRFWADGELGLGTRDFDRLADMLGIRR